jgi:hypothetical protein
VPAVVLALVVAGGVVWWLTRPVPAPVAVTVAADVPGPVAASAPVVPAAPAIQNPVGNIDAGPVAVAPLPELDRSDARLADDLNALLGRKKVDQFMLLDGFVRRVVATVDNLGREHAAPSRWPVQGIAGRFTTLHRDDGDIIDPDNAQRYATLVQFIEAVDARKVVQFYAGLYPLFQQAYQELGFPKGYFNDRLVAVIDLLLAAPVRETPAAVQLVSVKGPVASERPWTRYEFVEPELQALTAGQKMMVRVGPANQRRLRAKLIEYRRLLTRAALPPGVQP